jgi:hypothetical protein
MLFAALFQHLGTNADVMRSWRTRYRVVQIRLPSSPTSLPVIHRSGFIRNLDNAPKDGWVSWRNQALATKGSQTRWKIFPVELVCYKERESTRAMTIMHNHIVNYLNVTPVFILAVGWFPIMYSGSFHSNYDSLEDILFPVNTITGISVLFNGGKSPRQMKKE